MSYPDNPDFAIYTAPPAPQTARDLVDQEGVENVRDALPAAERQAFDQANPYRTIEEAGEHLDAAFAELESFDGDVQRTIEQNGYNAAQAQLVYQQTATVRQPLEEGVRQALQEAKAAMDTYRENLIAHVENRGLTQSVAFNMQHYSTPEQSVAAAARQFQPFDNRRDRRDRRDRRGGGGGGRTPLGQISGNQRRGR